MNDMADPSAPTRASEILPGKTTPGGRKSIPDSSAKRPSGLRPSGSRGSRGSRQSIKIRKTRPFYINQIPFFLGFTLCVCVLALSIHFSNAIFDTTVESAAIGSIYKVLGSEFQFPMSSAWVPEDSYLLFIDPNTNRIYRWTPSYGQYKYDYKFIDYFHPRGFFDKFFGPRNPHKVSFIIPHKYWLNRWLLGIGPSLVHGEWFEKKRHALAVQVKKLFNEDQEITVAKVTPYGSVLIVGKDKVIKGSTRAMMLRLRVTTDHLNVPYPKNFTDDIVHITGMAWSVKGDTLYVCETRINQILSFRYAKSDNDEEYLDDPEILITFTGAAYDVIVDEEDYLWVTLIGLNQVLRVSAAPGDEGQRITAVHKIPGGVTLRLVIGHNNVLYVTTGTQVPSGVDPVDNMKIKKKGNIYALNVTVKAGPVYGLLHDTVYPPGTPNRKELESTGD